MSSWTGTAERRGGGLGAGEGLGGGPGAAVGKNRRMNPPSDLPKVLQRVRQTACGLGQLRPQPVQFGRDRGLRHTQRKRERAQPLLRSVVQVTLDAAAALVGGG